MFLEISRVYILFNTLTSILKPLTLDISLTSKLIERGKEGKGGGGGREGWAA